jgi:hypothetical protein
MFMKIIPATVFCSIALIGAVAVAEPAPGRGHRENDRERSIEPADMPAASDDSRRGGRMRNGASPEVDGRRGDEPRADNQRHEEPRRDAPRDDVRRGNEQPRDSGHRDGGFRAAPTPREARPDPRPDTRGRPDDRRDDRRGDNGYRYDEGRDSRGWNDRDRHNDGRGYSGNRSNDGYRYRDNRGRNWRYDLGWYQNYRQQYFRYDRGRYYGRNRFSIGIYLAPRGYSYRVWRVGEWLPYSYYDRGRYDLSDYWHYDLYDPPYWARWIRVGDDALLIDLDTREVIDVVYGLFY